MIQRSLNSGPLRTLPKPGAAITVWRWRCWRANVAPLAEVTSQGNSIKGALPGRRPSSA